MTESKPSRGRHMTRNWTDAGIVDFDPIEWKGLLYCSSLNDFKTVMYGAVPALVSIILLCKFIPGFSMSMAFFVSGIHFAALVLMGLMSRGFSKGWCFSILLLLIPSLPTGYSLIRRNIWLCRFQVACFRCNEDVKWREWNEWTADGVTFGANKAQQELYLCALHEADIREGELRS